MIMSQFVIEEFQPFWTEHKWKYLQWNSRRNIGARVRRMALIDKQGHDQQHSDW